MADENLKHVFLRDTGRVKDFTSKQRGGPKLKFPQQNRYEHGAILKRKLEEAWGQAKAMDKQRQAVSLSTKDGVYLEFASFPEYELSTKSLEHRPSGIRLLNVRMAKIEGKDVSKATVFIPSGSEKVFLKKVQDYLNDEKDTKNNKPKNQPLIDSLNDIKLAVLESFWQGKKEWIPEDDPKWCEIWLSDDSEAVAEQFRDLAEAKLKILLQQETLKFPERRVFLGRVNRKQLQELITASPHIAEFRRASETADFFVELENREQIEWAQNLLERIRMDEKTNVCICILDTGINNGHMLLKPILDDRDCRSYDPLWGADDHTGHGTQMSGLAGYGDIQLALEANSPIFLSHRLESIKILPPKGENDPKLYGAIVAQSVSNISIDHPERQRILCMAVTAPKYTTGDGSPSSWSAAIDEFTSGYLDEQQKLMFVSAGNVDEMVDWKNYPESNKNWTVQNPGQAWNAITVGAYTEKAVVDSRKYNGSVAVASAGGLSPFSSTSCFWDNKWPIKPDIVLEGGNLLRDSFGCCSCSEFSLLTLHHKPAERQFSTIHATSAATAQAAWMAAQIQAAYPEAWPETIRALLIHSAEWTPEMQHQFLTGTSKGDYRELLRICGYGAPNLDKALWCMKNSVNLVIQTELQPYDKKPDSGYKTKDMQIHELPWPKEMLLDLGEIPVALKVTLSYFVEPGPGEIGWKDRYRYPSCLLRFDVNGTDTPETFMRRINAATLDEENETLSDGGSVKWTLGKHNRHLGSIHSDTWHTTAAQLAISNLIGVYPAVGWWRERAWLGRWNQKIRYALVVSLQTPEQDVDLYTPIVTQIKTPVSVKL
jgi:hypothetical protein